MNLTPVEGKEHEFDLVIDNSDTTLYTSCRRAFLFHVIRKRQYVKERIALFYGGVMHKVLAEHYTAMANDLPYSFAAAADLIQTEFSKMEVPSDDFRNADAASGLYAFYTDQYPVEDFNIAHDDNGKPLIEVPFRKYLTTIICKDPQGVLNTFHIHWAGRIDALVIRNNELLVVDHKTTSILGAGFFDEFFISQQMSGYCHWARSIGLPIKGYMVNAMCTRKPTKTGKQYECARQYFSVSDESLDAWKNNITEILQSLCEDLLSYRFPQETRWCKDKYGRCDFFDVCSADPSSQEAILTSGLYQTHEWSPLNP